MNYEARCAEATETQGINKIIAELEKLNIEATSAQTGGFTMCAYIELKNGKYIYANQYGASVYDEEDYQQDIILVDELEESNPKTIARAIYHFINN